MLVLPLLLFFFLGAIFGSFANVFIYRLPKGLSLGGRSACPACGKKLTATQLVPIFSFIFLKGRCAHCRKSISWRYPLIELITGLVFVLGWLFTRPVSAADYFLQLGFMVFGAFCVAVFVIDLEHYLILDWLVFPATVFFICLNVFLDGFTAAHTRTLSGLLGAVLGAAPFFLIWLFSKGRLMGFGDVKLMLPLGMFLGWPKILVAMLVAVIFGTLISLPLLWMGKRTFKSQLPFGCFLTLGAFLAYFYGQNLIAWYLSLLGI